MIRIAFLGSDSTHAEAFGSLINRPDAPFYGVGRVVSIWGDDRLQAARKAEVLGISKCANTISEALQEADLAMVIGRFGDSHYEPTRIALEHGLPTFVDKPFTTDLDQARALVGFASSRKASLVSSSPLRFARELETLSKDNLRPEFVVVAAPANCIDLGEDQRFQSAFFYGIHAVEMLLEIMGSEIRRFDILPGKRAITIQIEFPNATGSVQLVRDVDEFYEIRVYGKVNRHFTVALDGSYYLRLLSFLFHEFYRGSKTIPLESSLQAVTLLGQIDRADKLKNEA